MNRALSGATMIVAALGAISWVPSAARADLITNGGFEDPGSDPGSSVIYAGGSTIGTNGWVVTGVDVLVLSNTYIEPGTTFNSHSGDNALDITGSGNSSPTNGVSQLVATLAGQGYELSFFVGRADDTGRTPKRFYTSPSSVGLVITGSGTLLAHTTFTNANVTPKAVNWELFTVSFTADSSSTTIAFLNDTPAVDAGGNNYAGLDDVSLRAIPEPSSLVCLGLGGAGLIGYGLRRRRPSRS